MFVTLIANHYLLVENPLDINIDIKSVASRNSGYEITNFDSKNLNKITKFQSKSVSNSDDMEDLHQSLSGSFNDNEDNLSYRVRSRKSLSCIGALFLSSVMPLSLCSFVLKFVSTVLISTLFESTLDFKTLILVLLVGCLVIGNAGFGLLSDLLPGKRTHVCILTLSP